jgi:hypothetical protein
MLAKIKILSIPILATAIVGLSMVITTGSSSAASATISHSYHSSGRITPGSLVSLDPSQSNKIELSDLDNGKQLIGIANGQSIIAIDPDSGNTKVATNGTVDALVSNLNGNISTGNDVSVSALQGVGMKAGPGSHAIGLAEANFNNQSSGVQSQVIKDDNGNSHSILVGTIPINISITTLPISSGIKLNSLQQIIKSLTGHTLSTSRIILALIIALITIVLLVTLTYASIYGSIISIGRNPLARIVILRSLSGVIVMALLTAVVACISIIFLLS